MAVKVSKENVLLHKINMWAFLIVQILIFIIADVNSIDFYFVLGITIFAILFLTQGIFRISLDLSLNDISKISLTFKYVCTLAVSCIFIYQMYLKSNFVFMAISLSLFVMEILIIFVIAYRYKILRMIKMTTRRNKR